MISQIGFLLAVPAFRGIDEFDHAFRASSVGLGHWESSSKEPAQGRGFLITVDASVAAGAREACELLDYVGRDNCNPVGEPDDQGNVVIASAAATYNPAWYAVVGTVSRPLSGDASLYAMRITGILLVDAVLFAALLLARGARRPTWMLAGVIVAFSPVLSYSSILAAPNGLTYAAGLLLWVSLLRLAESEDDSGRMPMIGAAVGACLMIPTHSTGILFLVLIGLCAAPLLWSRGRPLWSGPRRRTIIMAFGLVAAVAAVSALWIAAAGTNDPRHEDESFGGMPASTAVTGPILWFLQSIATLAFRNEAAPPLVYALGTVALGALVVGGLRWGSRAQRLTIVGAIVASVVVPLTLTWLTYDALGAAWQGRYGLPLTVGIGLVGAHSISRTAVHRDFRPLLVVVLVAVVGSHVVAIGGMIHAFDVPLTLSRIVLLTAGGVAAAGLTAVALVMLGTDHRRGEVFLKAGTDAAE